MSVGTAELHPLELGFGAVLDNGLDVPGAPQIVGDRSEMKSFAFARRMTLE